MLKFESKSTAGRFPGGTLEVYKIILAQPPLINETPRPKSMINI